MVELRLEQDSTGQEIRQLSVCRLFVSMEMCEEDCHVWVLRISHGLSRVVQAHGNGSAAIGCRILDAEPFSAVDFAMNSNSSIGLAHRDTLSTSPGIGGWSLQDLLLTNDV
jgi:hypothetical protein